MLILEVYNDRFTNIRAKTAWIKPNCLNEAVFSVVERDVEVIVAVWFGKCVGTLDFVLGVFFMCPGCIELPSRLMSE